MNQAVVFRAATIRLSAHGEASATVSTMPIPSTMGVAVRSPRPSNSFSIPAGFGKTTLRLKLVT